MDHGGPQAAAALCDCEYLDAKTAAAVDAEVEATLDLYLVDPVAIASRDYQFRDIFALGLTLYEITKQQPIPRTPGGFADYEAVRSHLEGSSDASRLHVLDELICKMVDPPASPMSANDVHQELGVLNILECQSCFDNFAFNCSPEGTREGVECDSHHFLCSGCLDRQIDTRLQRPVGQQYVNAEELLGNDGAIAYTCMCSSAAFGVDRCTAPPYTDAQIARRVTD